MGYRFQYIVNKYLSWLRKI